MKKHVLFEGLLLLFILKKRFFFKEGRKGSFGLIFQIGKVGGMDRRLRTKDERMGSKELPEPGIVFCCKEK